MTVLELADPAEFLRRAEPILLADEARHNLLLGIAGRLVERPEDAPGFRLWLVEDAGRVEVAAARTPPWNAVLSRTSEPGPARALADHLLSQAEPLPGVTGALPEARWFAEAWEGSGRTARVRTRMGIYALTTVASPGGVSGRMRSAETGDRELLVGWAGDFEDEALAPGSPRNAERMIDSRLADESWEGLTIWQDPDPVCMCGFGGPTPNGIRIGPVYTPPEHRGRGYASALVARTSQRLLDRGRRLCFLYTDLANPTSNAIYQRIGYEFVCESAEYAFGAR